MLKVITGAIEIGVLAVLLYYLLVFIRQTGAVQALRGLAILALAFVLARLFHLDVLSAIFTRALPFLFLAFVVIFNTELRRALAELGRGRLFSGSLGEKRIIKEVVGAVMELSRRKIGGLIAIERDIGLGIWVQSGVMLDSRVSRELLLSIFMPGAPLHDGGVIIEGDKIKAAACLFPLSQRRHPEGMGMRHKAALGLAEASDAFLLIVSEETGTVSAAFRGRLIRNLEEEGLEKLLEKNVHFKTPRKFRNLSPK